MMTEHLLTTWLLTYAAHSALFAALAPFRRIGLILQAGGAGAEGTWLESRSGKT